ncbi:MAG: alpha/beta hydrolase [Elusimicrobia bacterium]|nr:alpha/beta hydrolase [Elusimicrobiota bacterium]MDE2509754.1 alpha/beta hydrolase [Elusimicrobiota bacterium]
MRVHPAVWTILAAAALWIGLRWFENAMLFAPSRAMTAHPGSYGLAFERLWLTADDGVRLRAWWIPGPRADSPVLIGLHGNGGTLSNRVEKMKLFHDAGVAQLWVDWRGYGESSGHPSEAGIERDARAAWNEAVVARGMPPGRIVLYGESLGCGAAVYLAARVPAAGLIMDSGFASVPEMAKTVLPWFPRFLIRARFDNLGTLPRVKMPTLFLHSPEDEIVPYAQARLNYAAAAGPKTFVDLKGSHNDGFLDAGAVYPAAISHFLRQVVPIPSETGSKPAGHAPDPMSVPWHL